MPPRVFLLSPASSTGARAQILLSPRAQFPLAQQLRSPAGAPLGEVFSFLSGLYFRGKLTYALTFATPLPVVGGAKAPPYTRSDSEKRARGVGRGFSPGRRSRNRAPFPVLVITPSLGLQPPDYPVTPDLLQQFARVDIHAANEAYTRPLEESAVALNDAAGPDAEIVLLGSIATGKYVDILLRVFGDRLLFPAEFVGRGDMSRGGLLLRCVRAGMELTYVPVKGAIRHGARPPRLPRLPRE